MVYYCSLTVLKSVVDFSKKVDHFTKTLIETDTVELFMDFIDGKIDIMTCYPAVHGIASLCCHSLEARERVIFANGLSKLGHYIYKDNSQKLHVKAFNQGLELYQIDELERLREVYVDKVHFEGTKYVGRHDASYHVLMRWSRKVQTACAQIILKVRNTIHVTINDDDGRDYDDDNLEIMMMMIRMMMRIMMMMTIMLIMMMVKIVMK